MSRRVEGVYATVEEARAAVERLKDQGYSRDQISIVANADVRRSFSYQTDVDVSTDAGAGMGVGSDNRSVWEKIKDSFTMDENYNAADYATAGGDASTDPLSGYHEEIERGSVVVLVEEGVSTQAAGMRTDTHAVRDSHDDTIELREEHVDVDKQKVQTGEVSIGKRIVEETETVDVPVTHEEVTIERRPARGKHAAGEIDATDTEEIVVPVTEEQVTVDKDTHVAEEVNVRKETVTENKQVTEKVRREELDVDSTGDVHTEDARHLRDEDEGYTRR